VDAPAYVINREKLLHTLYEAAELEHNLMCTYLYAAFSLRAYEDDGLAPDEREAVSRWRREVLSVAVDEMSHLVAVWNITSALGGSPRFGRGNFPLDPGGLPASVVVRLAPFNEAVLQHFIHLERPAESTEPDGEDFRAEFQFRRGARRARLVPMGLDYDTVGAFYETLGNGLRSFVERLGEADAFCGDPALQLSTMEVDLPGAKPVICLKTALAAFTAIVQEGEGAPADAVGSHFQRFLAIRDEWSRLRGRNPHFQPFHPAATNPVQRVPMRPAGRVWIENEEAAATVDVANAAYGLMLRLVAHGYALPRPSPEKNLAIDIGIGLMRAVTHLGEHAARLPAGPANPDCNAGMSFTALRDSAPLPPGPSARRFFVERLDELAAAAAELPARVPRLAGASRLLTELARRGVTGFGQAAEWERSRVLTSRPLESVSAGVSGTPLSADASSTTAASAAAGKSAASAAPPVPKVVDGIDEIEGEKLTLLYDGRNCIHSRWCVTWGPNVFLANVKGAWIRPDGMDVERLAEIAHVCPSGAIRYRRKDGQPEEAAPLVNLVSVREGGPYAVRADIRLSGEPLHYRATLCRCGASQRKPFCDGSHHAAGFAATGEPPSGRTDMLPVRDGPLAIDPQLDGPLQIRGNMEIISGTGRVVARATNARLCRCGGSSTKPFCDGMHERIGFRST
jgi:CDGSH-type Zn-finger protein/uncharacterized Fe-S cluster protein YjdI